MFRLKPDMQLMGGICTDFLVQFKKIILQPKLMMILKQQFEEKLFILQNCVHHIQRIGNHFLEEQP
jgi:hypothetical protein